MGKSDGYRGNLGMQPVRQPSRRSSALSAATPIHHHKRSRRGRERWRRMDHLQHWRNGSLRSVHSSSPSLSPPVAHDQTLSLPKPQPNRANERASEGTRERGERRKGGGLLLGSFDTTSSSPAIPPARPPDRWNTLRRGGRGYRQLESWHQTTMGGGEREEKKPDGRATAAKCLLVQSASRPHSLPPSTRFSTVVIRHLRRHRRRRRRSHPVLTLDAFMHND